jgi:type I restriction enzyme S subunit
MNFRPFEEFFQIPSRNGLTKPKRVRGAGYKMVNMGELFKFPRLKNVKMDRVPLSEKEYESSLLERGDLLFARQSLVLEGAGQCSIFLSDDEPVCFESHLIRCRVDLNISNPLFLFYYFSSFLGKQEVFSMVEQGAGVAGIRSSDLAKVMVPDIGIKTQSRIAKILGVLDDKIAINTQTNQTLEVMAQAIFKSWFVDFDPVKAKVAVLDAGGSAEDAEIAAMCAISTKDEAVLDQLKTENPEAYAQLAATAAFFPAAFQTLELGDIPEGWEVDSLSDLIQLTGGGTPKRSEAQFWDGNIPWFSVRDIPNDGDIFVVDTTEKITDAGLKKSSTKLLKKGTTIITARGTVGKLALLAEDMCMNQSCYGVNGKDTGPYFNYFYLKEAVSTLQQNTHGAVFDTITTKTFETYRSSFCGKDLARHFDTMLLPIMEQIENNLRESISLAEARDTLLSKLLSGDPELLRVIQSQDEESS